MQLLSYSGYSLWIVRLLADSDGLLTAPALAERLALDTGFVQQILRRLQAAKLVGSRWGYRGGYYLAKPAAQITQRAVIEAAEEAIFGPEAGDPPLLAKARKLLADRLGPALEAGILDWPLPPKAGAKK